jgi:hypothetical protein
MNERRVKVVFECEEKMRMWTRKDKIKGKSFDLEAY